MFMAYLSGYNVLDVELDANVEGGKLCDEVAKHVWHTYGRNVALLFATRAADDFTNLLGAFATDPHRREDVAALAADQRLGVEG